MSIRAPLVALRTALGICALAACMGTHTLAAESKDAWGIKGQLPLNLEPLLDNDAVADVTDRSDGNFDCPDHAIDIPGSVFPAENLPATGSRFSFNGIYFLFPSKERGDFNNVVCSGQRLEVPAGRYKALHVVGTSENGSFRGPVQLAYKEGPAEVELALTDWCQQPSFGERSAFEAEARFTWSAQQRRMVRDAVRPHLWLQKLPLDAARTLEAVTLPYNRRMHLFAATLEAADWADEQRVAANETAEVYESLSQRRSLSTDDVTRRLATLAAQLDRYAASGPAARQFGWLRTQAAYLQSQLGGRYSSLLYGTRLAREIRAIAADVRSLLAGNDPFPARSGCFLRSYRSEVDGSLQSYSLAVPRDYKADGKDLFPLLITLHGHGWYRAFQGHPQKVVDGVIIAAPQGRGSQDYMLAAEGDVLAVLDDVMRDYRIDPDRVTLEGHSMGGTGSWQVGVHYPDRFADLAPVCGNADRHAWDGWNQVRSRRIIPIPPRFAVLRAHVLDTLDPISYAGNLLNLPSLAAHGGRDETVPVENSRNMAERLKALGCPVDYREFPNVRHWGFPNDFYTERWDWMLAQRRNPAPERVRYRTASLRHGGAWWVRIERFVEPLKFAEIDARHLVAQPPSAVDPGRFEITTSNVAAFSLDLPKVWSLREVTLDGQTMKAEGNTPIFVLADGRWTANPLPPGLAKKKGLEGPVGDLFLSSFLLVRGTSSPDEWEREVIRREVEAFAHDWERMYNCRPRVKDDTAVTDDDIARHNLILYGGPAANALTARIADKLPIRIERVEGGTGVGGTGVGGTGVPPVYRIRVGEKTFQGPDVGVKLCYPNPLNPERAVAVFAGLSPDALDQINNRFGNWFGWGPYDNYNWFDYGVFDSRTLSPETFLCVGFFDQGWKLDERHEFLGDDLVRGMFLPQRVPRLRRLPDPPPEPLYLSDLMPSLVDQHKGIVGYSRSFGGNALTVRKKTFGFGLGVRAPSVVEYQLDGKYGAFRASVGIDLEGEEEVSKARARGEYVQFLVYGDGKRLYSSEWLQWDDKPEDVEVEIKGVKTLRLEADCSSARWLVGSSDWGNARVSTR